MSGDNPDIQERGRRAMECIDRLERVLAAERAELQRRIADAIRLAPPERVAQARTDALDAATRCDAGRADLVTDDMRVVLAALAAAAKYPEILDAVNQIAAMHAAERGG